MRQDDPRQAGARESRHNDGTGEWTDEQLGHAQRDATARRAIPHSPRKSLFLARPRSYAEPTQRVDTIETHMSWVFLTDRHAWKLKKPVRQSYLDFSTEAARRHLLRRRSCGSIAG